MKTIIGYKESCEEKKEPKTFTCSGCGVIFESDEYHVSLNTRSSWDKCPVCGTHVVTN